MTTRYVTVNVAWQLGGDAKLLRTVAATADVLGLVECRTFDNQPVDVAAILGDDWAVWQDTSSGAKAGTAIAIRKDSAVHARRKTQAYSEFRMVASGNGEVQARYMRKLKVQDGRKRATIYVVHIPLESSGKQNIAMEVVSNDWKRTRGRKIMMADGNQAPIVFAKRLGAPHYSGSKPMVIAWSNGWGEVRCNWTAVSGSDHKKGTFRAGES